MRIELTLNKSLMNVMIKLFCSRLYSIKYGQTEYLFQSIF